MLRTIPFANDGNCDPWYIFGQSYWLTKPGHWFPYLRQIARLPATAPAYILTSLFHSIFADYVYFYASYTLALLFFYLSAAILLSRWLALGALIAFAFHPLIVGNYSTTLNAWALTYDLLSLYFALRASGATRLRSVTAFTFLSGAALGVAMNAWLGIAAFAFANYICVAVSLLTRRETSRGERIVRLALATLALIAGVVLASLAQAVVDVIAFHGWFWQILNQYNWVPAVSWSSAHIFWRRDWFEAEGQVGMLVAAATMSGISIVLSIRRWSAREAGGQQKLIAAFSIGTLATICLLLIYNQIGGVFLHYDYYYYFFIPYVLLAVFAAPLSLGAQSGLLITSVLAVAAAISVLVPNDAIEWIYKIPHQALTSVGAALLAVVSCVVWSFAQGRAKALFGCVFALSIAGMMLAQRPPDYGADVWSGDPNHSMKAEYVRTRMGMEFLRSLPFKQPPSFWVDSEQTLQEAWVYAPSYMACGYNHFPTIDPQLWSHPGRDFVPGDDVVVVSGRKNVATLAPTAFASLGLSVRELAEKDISYAGFRYMLVAFQVTGRKGSPTFPKLVQPSDPPSKSPLLPRSYGLPRRVDSSSQIVPVERQLIGPLWIVMKLQVHERARVLLATRDGRSTIYDGIVDPASAPIKMTIPVQLFDEAGNLELRGDVRILSVAVFVPRPTQLMKTSVR